MNPLPTSDATFLDHYENPYYLHSSDHAGLILVSDRLSSGAEFHSWRRSVRMALNVRNKLGFIDGTIPKPPDSHRDAGSWSHCNDMVATWLMNSVSKKIGQSLLFMTTAESIWKNIISRFKQEDAPRVYEIEQQLSRLQQGSMDISTYYTALVTLWEEYKNYVDFPVCTCGRCECNAAVLWENLQLRSRVTKFLMGLNEAYEPTRRHILMLKPIPSIEDVFNLVIQDERQKSIKPSTPATAVFQSSGPSEPVSVTAPPSENPVIAATQSTGGFRPKSRPLCTYCGQLGHVVAKCFKLHGYPPGHRNNRSSAPPSGFIPRGQNNYQQPRPQFQNFTPQQQQYANQNVAANVLPEQSGQSSGQMDRNQLQSLIQQLQAFMPPTINAVTTQQSTVNENGYMDPQSSAGNVSFTPHSSFPNVTISFPSTSLRFDNNILTFQHQCLSSLSNTMPNGAWIIDSGATTHVCSDLSLFTQTSPVTGVTVSLPNGIRESISHIGTVQLSKSLTLHNVLHVPSFRFNLISVCTLLRDNHSSAHFYPDHCLLQESTQGLMIGRGRLLRNLYVLEPAVDSSLEFCGSLQVDGNLWHQRLGHPSTSKLKSLTGTLPITTSSLHKSEVCPVCPLAKQKRLPFVSNNNMSKSAFDLVHLDVWGPFGIESIEGYKYFLTLVDDCTRATWVYMMKNKSEVLTVFPIFVQHVKTQYNTDIKVIRSDNAPELAFTNLIQKHGIFHQYSCAYTPQQNSVVERKHQHILNVARALLFQSNIPLVYWSDCICTAVFLINRTPSPLLNDKTPYELLQKRVPDYLFLKTFGCLCYASTLLKDRNKFSARADKCVFLGYPSGYKGYKVLHLDSNKISVTRNIVFHENTFPFLDTSFSVSPSLNIFDRTILPAPIPVVLDSVVPKPVVPNATNIHRETVPVTTGQGRLLGDRPKRHTRAPGYLSQYHCALAQSNFALTPSSSLPSSSISYPLSSVLAYDNFNPFISHMCFPILLRQNQHLLSRPCYLQIFEKPRLMSCRLWRQMELGQLNLYLLVRMWLVANGYIPLSTMQTAP